MLTFLLSFVARFTQLTQRFSSIGLLIIRLAIGMVFIAHGLDKLFGTFGGGGLPETTKQFAELGLQPASFQALMAGLTEAGGGILLTLGLFTRLGAVMVASTMVVAILVVHLSGGLFARDGGFEYPLVILASTAHLAMVGGGHLSLDAFLLRYLNTKLMTITDASK
ncbi:MAG: DoxX family protein [Vampirovibrionales bacterium]